MTAPNFHVRLVNPDGTLMRPLIDYLRNSGASDADISSLAARLTALEASAGVRLVGSASIAVSGSAASGYHITYTGNSGDPLEAQIFGG